jgi:hypothetical protein
MLIHMIPIRGSDPGEQLKRYLQRRSGATDPEKLALDGRPLGMRRKTVLAVIGGALVSAECWIWMLIVPWASRASLGQGTFFGLTVEAAVGLFISIATVAVVLTVAVQLYTEVDTRGIRRPDWAGGKFIPWSSVTQVSTRASPETLQVRAGGKRINLSLLLFSNPAALVALIRRHVPAERLKNISAA